MGSHALLSPSGAERWMACTPSARLEEQFPTSTSSYAEEGTAAHELADLINRYNFKKITGLTKPKFTKAWEELKKGPFYNAEMQQHVEAFCNYVYEEFNATKAKCKDAVIAFEERLDFSEYVPEGYGTGDVVIIADGDLTVIDFKYGKGVTVSAEENKQMMLYALGAMLQYSFLYDIKNVRMIIHQPRLDNISDWSISADALTGWAETELKEKAALAFDGAGKYCPGDHCRFCRAKATCRARAEENIKLAKYDFVPADTLSIEEIADILKIGEKLVNWFGDISEHALLEAVDGTQYPGWKLVEGRSNRKIVDENSVIDALRELNYLGDEIFNTKLKGIGDLEKLMGKEPFNEALGQYVIKPQGKPVLVLESDKRPALNSAEAAAADFENVNIA